MAQGLFLRWRLDGDRKRWTRTVAHLTRITRFVLLLLPFPTCACGLLRMTPKTHLVLWLLAVPTVTGDFPFFLGVFLFLFFHTSAAFLTEVVLSVTMGRGTGIASSGHHVLRLIREKLLDTYTAEDENVLAVCEIAIVAKVLLFADTGARFGGHRAVGKVVPP